jgi:hypothetical protein
VESFGLNERMAVSGVRDEQQREKKKEEAPLAGGPGTSPLNPSPADQPLRLSR